MSFADARRAVLSHDAAELRRLLERGAPTRTSLGEDLLALAVTNGAQEAVNVLLESGAEFAEHTLAELFRNRPSAAAIRCLPDALLQRPPDLFGARSLLERALLNRAEDAAAELLRRGALVSSGALDVAVGNGMCADLALSMAAPQALRDVSPRTLALAADRGDWGAVRRLVSAGVSVQAAADRDGGAMARTGFGKGPPGAQLQPARAETVAEQLIVAAAKQSADFDLPDVRSTAFVLQQTVESPRFPRLLARASDETVRNSPALLARATADTAELLLDRGAPVTARALAHAKWLTLTVLLHRRDPAELPLTEAIDLTHLEERRIELMRAGGMPSMTALRTESHALVTEAVALFPQLLQPEDPTSGETLVDVLAGLSTLQIALDAGAPMTLSAMFSPGHPWPSGAEVAAFVEQRQRALRGHELVLILTRAPAVLPDVPGLGAALDEVILGLTPSRIEFSQVDPTPLLDAGALSLRGLSLLWRTPRDSSVCAKAVRWLGRKVCYRHARRVPLSVRPPEELLAAQPTNAVPRTLRRVVEVVRLRCVVFAYLCLSRRRPARGGDVAARIGLLPSRARAIVGGFLWAWPSPGPPSGRPDPIN